MPRSSAVPRTLKLLRDAGYVVDVVEQYNAFSRQRSDYLGFVDVLAINNAAILAVQVCGQDVSEHIRKMTGEREGMVRAWLGCPNRFCLLIGWRKVLVKRGGKQRVFKPRIIHFELGADGLLQHKEYKDGETIHEIIYKA